MEKKYFIGIDVSKETLDVALFLNNKKEKKDNHIQVENNKTGFKRIDKWMKKLSANLDEFMICLEHTGIYTLDLCMYLEEKSIWYSLLCPLHLKRSMGLVRGKNDKIDAHRIAEHCYLYREVLEPSKIPAKDFRVLRLLINQRQLAVVQLAGLKASKKEFAFDKTEKMIEREQTKMKQLKDEIKEIEEEIHEIIGQSELLNKNYTLIKSIVGIGPVNAFNIILATKNFTAFTNARQFACYIGIAPFEHSSGKSVRGGTRTSKYGFKDLKGLITQAAKAAVKHDKELGQYYTRKIGEGKHHGVVMNAVKFKLIERVFSVIRRGKEYINSLDYATASRS